ncbi:MAG: carbonic anhydrase [Marinifilaceae bacterium]|jgi:carbonic anhydrase|nr:carbonic anhydrase [Marinifilaceae bacterium]
MKKHSILKANKQYSETYKEASIDKYSKTRIAILTCMDARLDPLKICGLELGNAYIIRNAGARLTEDAIRSFLLSYKLLDTKEWYIIQHTDCGLTRMNNKEIDDLFELKEDDNKLNWMSFTNHKRTLIDDLEQLRNYPLVPIQIPIHAMIFDSKTGDLELVASL